MNKCYATDDLIRFLGLDENTKYSANAIEKIINNKKIDVKSVQKFFPEYSMCFCGSCPVNKKQFMKFIRTNCFIKANKPNSFCYGYDDKPVQLTTIEFNV